MHASGLIITKISAIVHHQEYVVDSWFARAYVRELRSLSPRMGVGVYCILLNNHPSLNVCVWVQRARGHQHDDIY
jgi:hypothetical protein